MPAKIALHIGAHKTATTHLQRSLSEKSADLTAAGVRFFGPPFFRKGANLSERFGLNGDVTADQARAAFARMSGDARRVIISEENFIGTMHNRFGQMAFPLYPQAPDRIEALAGRIAPDGLDVYLGLRNPATYISSCYAQALIGGRKVVLEEVKAHNKIEAIDWADLVGRIAGADGVRSVTVWRFEDYQSLFAQIVARLTGANVAVPPLDDKVHPGLSKEAVARILMRYADGKGRQAAVRARDKFPVGADYPAFDAFDPWEHSQATARYDAQIAQIDAMTKVTRLKA